MFIKNNLLTKLLHYMWFKDLLPKGKWIGQIKINTLQKKEWTSYNDKSYYSDLINPYQVIFNPSYLELNDKKYVDYFVLNTMVWNKRPDFLKPLIQYWIQSTTSLFFSPLNIEGMITRLKKELPWLERKYNDDLDSWKEPDKKLKQTIEENSSILHDLEEWNISYLNFWILFSHEIDKNTQVWDADPITGVIRWVVPEDYENLVLSRKNLYSNCLNRLTQPTVFYPPVGQIEEAYLSQQPLMEYRIKDWSSISNSVWMILYPFFTESKEPSIKDGVPFGINRNTGNLLFFNHSQLYNDSIITNRNMNIFWGTWSWKSSFLRSQIMQRISFWDHFIIIDPKRDYAAFTSDMKWQNISFTIDKPIWLNLFRRNTDTYTVWTEIREVQSIERKKENLIKIMSIMCSFLTEQTREAEFAKNILDTALSNVYKDSPSWEDITLQIFYDKYLTNTINYFVSKESEKINSYSLAWESLKANFASYVRKEDGSYGQYYKMFLPVSKSEELVLEDGPLINFDLSALFRNDALFTIWTLIAFEFTWDQIATRTWDDRTCYIVIDENWKLLQYKQAWEYEEGFARLIRWLWGWIYTMSQNLNEYVNSKNGLQLIDQAQVNIVLKLEPIQLDRLKEHFKAWFTEEIIKDYDEINKRPNSYWQGYIYMKSRAIPMKYLYLTANKVVGWSWQERESWRKNMDSEEWFASER